MSSHPTPLSAQQDLWIAVRLMAEGSDWKRDQGETLTAWAQRTLKAARSETAPTRGTPPGATIQALPQYVSAPSAKRTPADEAAWAYCQISATSNRMLHRDDVLRVLHDRLRELDPTHPMVRSDGGTNG